MEKEFEKSIELELKRDCDKMKIEQKQIELFFFQSEFKIVPDVSFFTQQINTRGCPRCNYLNVLSSLWLPSMESSNSF